MLPMPNFRPHCCEVSTTKKRRGAVRAGALPRVTSDVQKKTSSEGGRVESVKRKENESESVINIISEKGVVNSFQLLGLYIKINVGNKAGRALVDTGASLSIINKSMAGEIMRAKSYFLI